jgi:hypothetical protein
MKWNEAELRDALTDPPGYALDQTGRDAYEGILKRQREAIFALKAAQSTYRYAIEDAHEALCRAVQRYNLTAADTDKWVKAAFEQVNADDTNLACQLDGLDFPAISEPPEPELWPTLCAANDADEMTADLAALDPTELAPLTAHEVTEATAILDERAEQSRKELDDLRAWDNGRKL